MYSRKEGVDVMSFSAPWSLQVVKINSTVLNIYLRSLKYYPQSLMLSTGSMDNMMDRAMTFTFLLLIIYF